MIKYFNKINNYRKDIFDLLIFFNFLSLLISCFLSKNFVISFAYTLLYFVGIYLYYYFKGIYFDLNENNILEIYIIIRNVFFSLLLLVLFFYFFTEDYVSTEKRLYGGRIANLLIICPIIFLISLYLTTTTKNNVLNKLCLISSLIIIFFAYSRSTWWSTIFLTILLYFKIFFIDYEKKEKQKLKFFTIVIILIFILFLFLNFSEISFILSRGQEDPFSTSGRDIIAAWVIDYMNERLFGLGLGTGFKKIFPTLIGNFDYLGGLEVEKIGTAHNAYLEILMSGGWFSFFCYIFLSILPILFFVRNFKKIIRSNFYLLFLIFIFLIMNNMVNATSTIPSYLTFSIFWVTLSAINLLIYQKKINLS